MRAHGGLLFFVDESLPHRSVLRVLEGHTIEQVDLSAKDPEILRSAEQRGAILVVQDKWFLRELYRLPCDHRHCFRHAGVIKLPGEWDKAEPRLIKYLSVIEELYRLAQLHAEDHRIGVDLSRAEIRIIDPWI